MLRLRTISLVARWELQQWLRFPAVMIITLLSPVLFLILSSRHYTEPHDTTSVKSYPYFISVKSEFDLLQSLQRELLKTTPSFNGNPKYVLIPQSDNDTTWESNAIIKVKVNGDVQTVEVSDVNPPSLAPVLCSDLGNALLSLHGNQLLPRTELQYRKPIPFDTSTARNREPTILLMIMFLFLISSSATSGQMIVRSILDERKTKLSDIYLSSMSGVEYITGKFAGVATIGLSQALIWLGIVLMTSSILNVQLSASSLSIALTGSFSSYLCICGLYTLIASWSTNESTAIFLMYLVSLFTAIPLVTSSMVSVNQTADIMGLIPFFTVLVHVQKFILNASVNTTSLLIGIVACLSSIVMLLMLSVHLFRLRIQRGL